MCPFFVVELLHPLSVVAPPFLDLDLIFELLFLLRTTPPIYSRPLFIFKLLSLLDATNRCGCSSSSSYSTRLSVVVPPFLDLDLEFVLGSRAHFRETERCSARKSICFARLTWLLPLECRYALGASWPQFRHPRSSHLLHLTKNAHSLKL